MISISDGPRDRPCLRTLLLVLRGGRLLTVRGERLRLRFISFLTVKFLFGELVSVFIPGSIDLAEG